VDSNRGGISASLGAKDLSGDIKNHRRRLKIEEYAETDTPRFLLLSEQAGRDIKVINFILFYTNVSIYIF
jgi:hypothetical protein